MKESKLLRKYFVAGVALLTLQCLPAFASQMMSMPSAGTNERTGSFDWLENTQRTLDELKGKLNLVPGQIAGWDAWSAGVAKDAHQQLEQKKDLREYQQEGTKPSKDFTTPELMQRGIKHLQAEINWMQEHMIQLEAAQARTQTFYDRLDVNQQTIFDLFWHEMYHRSVGHDDKFGMQGRESFGPGYMKGEPDHPTVQN